MSHVGAARQLESAGFGCKMPLVGAGFLTWSEQSKPAPSGIGQADHFFGASTWRTATSHPFESGIKMPHSEK